MPYIDVEDDEIVEAQATKSAKIQSSEHSRHAE